MAKSKKKPAMTVGLSEIRKRISEHLYYLDPDSDYSKEQRERSVEVDKVLSDLRDGTGEVISDNSDPRLVGWRPDGAGICGPKGSNFTVKKVECEDGGFATVGHCIVTYDAVLPSGETVEKLAFFTKEYAPYVYDIAALRRHIEKSIGEDIFDYCERLDQPYEDAIARFGSLEKIDAEERNAIAARCEGIRAEISPKIAEPYIRDVIRPLHYHLDCMRVLEEIFEPLGRKHCDVLLREIENRINSIFSIAIELRQRELEGLHLQDAARGRAVVAGGDRGGRALAERSSAHAAAWKRNFATWFQPLLERHNRQGISRDGAIDLAEKEWPAGGFIGLPGQPRQIAFPSRQTMLNTLKEFERNGIITRKSPPRGRSSTVK